MALNRAFANARKNFYPVASGTVSGDPVIVGAALPGVALTDADPTTPHEASVDTGGAYWFNVEGTPDAGDILYYHAGPPILINDTSGGGVRFGYAMQTTAAVTGYIPVKIGY